MVEDALGKFGGYWLDFDFDYILNKRADIHILFDQFRKSSKMTII